MGGALVDVCKSETVTRQVRRKLRKEAIREFHLVLLTFADAGLLVEVVPCRTLALEAAKGVDAVPALAQTWQLLALVDVWRASCLDHKAVAAAVKAEAASAARFRI